MWHYRLIQELQLLQAMETRCDIDIAIGLMMERYSLTRQDSFENMRQLARSEHSKIGNVASGMVEVAEKLVIPQDIPMKFTSGKQK